MNKLTHNLIAQITAVVCAIFVIMITGCQQPAASGLLGANGANRSPLFNLGGGSVSNRGIGGSLFGGNTNRFANNVNAAGNAIGIQTNSPEQYQQFQAMAEQLRIANQRLSAYDSDNQLLNTELAAHKQKLQLANQYSQTLKEQLGDTSNQARVAINERQSAMQQLASMQQRLQQTNQNPQSIAARNSRGTPGQLAGYTSGGNPNSLGSATIRANNSLMSSLSRIQIPGGQARMDGDVIRIEFPSDQMFVPGTYQIQPARQPMLRNLVGTIQQNFPNQIIGIEAHWDGTPLSPAGTSDHQLTATQSLALFDQLVGLGLPRKQMFTMAMASNRPRHSASSFGGTSPNRRLEVVIYPESWQAR